MTKKKNTRTVQQELAENKLTTTESVRTFLTGRRLRIVNDTTGHGYPPGTEHTITDDTQIYSNGSRWSIAFLTYEGYMGGRCALSDCVFCADTVESLTVELTNIDNSLASLTAAKYVAKEKIKFLQETKTEGLDYNAFITYKIQSLLGSGKSKANKTKEIMSLFS
jgi:hypothetical protein